MKQVRRQAITLFAAAIGGAALGAGLMLATDGAVGQFVPGPGMLVVALMIYLVCIGVHEAGHMAAGALVGFRPLLFIAGPLRLERHDGRVRASLNRSIAMAGGLALCAPVGVHDLRRRTIALVAGGPLASLMIGVQCLLLWSVLSPLLHGPTAGAAAFALLLGGAGSLGIGILTLLPMRVGGFYSDGARLLRLLRDNDETAREVSLMALTGLTLGGMRPRDWDAELVRSAAGIRDGGPFEASALQFAHLHALDCGDTEAARAYLEETLARVDQLPPATRGAVWRSAAVFFALYGGDAGRARACLDAAGRGSGLMEAPHQRALAEGAVLLAEGDVSGAMRAAGTAQQLILRSVERGSTALDGAHLDRILSAAAAAPGSPG